MRMSRSTQIWTSGIQTSGLVRNDVRLLIVYVVYYYFGQHRQKYLINSIKKNTYLRDKMFIIWKMMTVRWLQVNRLPK